MTQVAAVLFSEVTVVRGGLRILDSVSAEVPRGSATAIIGPNGAGKTSLLLAMLGQLEYKGAISIASYRQHPARLGYVPQRLEFDRALPISVIDFMVLGKQRLPLWFGVRQRSKNQALETLAAVKADHLSTRKLGALSGGELQRVLLALAIEQDPDILILDEPNAGVDIGGENLMCELLDQLRSERGFTQIMVTHDLSLVTAHSNHLICLNRCVIGAGPTSSTLTTSILTATFGIHMNLAELNAIHLGLSGEARHDEGHVHE